MKRVLLIFVLFLPSLLLSQTVEDSFSTKKINWEENNIEIRISKKLDKNNRTLAAARIKAENWIYENKVNIFLKNILEFNIDSINSISQIINKTPQTYYNLENQIEEIEPSEKNMSTNMEYLELVFRMPLYPNFVTIFYNQSQYIEKYKKLDHMDYGQFTGLIIYVPTDINLKNQNSTGNLERVLFPKIYDEDLNLIMDFTMVSPEYMKRWGMVIYGNSFNESLYQSRIGITPLRIIAKGLFGKNNSDIIISRKEANKLLGTTDNLKIISQSRILILNQEK